MVTLEELNISLRDSDRAAEDPQADQCTPVDGAPTTPDVPEPGETTEASSAQDAQDGDRLQRAEEVRYVKYAAQEMHLAS